MHQFKAVALFIILMTFALSSAGADMQDDPVLWKITFSELAVHQYGSDSAIIWDAMAWLGTDQRKLALKSRGKRQSGITEKMEMQFLYSHAIAPFWDFRLGWRRDNGSAPSRDWAMFEISGLAPYFIDTDITLFISENYYFGLRFEAEHEWALGQRLILLPEIEVNLYSFNDVATEISSGLSELELGVRWHYLLTRKLAPYLGVQWKKLFGDSADLISDQGASTGRIEISAGLHFWF